jgi:polyisoprenoid-binding protein YceI
MTERAHSDEVLIERLRSGDPLAFDVIDARYRRALTRHAEWRLGPARRALAEELVQETFLRAYRSLMAGDREVLLRPWLYRILQNAIVDEQRRPAPPDGDPDDCPRTTAEAACEVARDDGGRQQGPGQPGAHLAGQKPSPPGGGGMRSAAVVAPGTWSADPARSTVAFTLARWPSGTLSGRFEDVVAELVVGRHGDSELFGVVRTASLLISDSDPSTRAAAMDALGARRFPRIAFESSAVDIAGALVQVDGRLTVKGTTLPITATGELAAEEGDLPLRLALETILDRRQFGVDLTGPPAGRVVYAYETQLQVELVMRRMWVP